MNLFPGHHFGRIQKRQCDGLQVMAQGAVERMEAAKKEEENTPAKAESMDMDENEVNGH